ncbi:MAG: M48 family metallopeptidase [Chloroflexi bacterium]|nr:M48 family metallopeptidase [Chloroflexota bacterium]
MPTKEMVLELAGATVIKSPRRKRTSSWCWADGHLVLRVPARTSHREILRLIELARQRATAPPRRLASDATLEHEAAELNARYFGGVLPLRSIRYVTMTTRRGSCTPASGEVRISRQLASVPPWVRQAVIHHELCHLLEPGHGPAFQALLARYPLYQHAEDYLRLLERGTPVGAFPLSEEERQALLALLDQTGALPELRARLANDTATSC